MMIPVKPTHTVLSTDPSQWKQADLWKQMTVGDSFQNDVIHDTSTASSVEEMSDSYTAVSSVNFLSALRIWLAFLGRSALYFGLVASLIGGGLMGIYVLKIEMNLDKLLTFYVAGSCVLWFCLTPFALYYSLRARRRP